MNWREAALPVVLAAVTGACGGAAATIPEKIEPAVVEAGGEVDPARMRLTSKAMERLGLTVAVVEEMAVTRVRRFGGTVVPAPDGSPDATYVRLVLTSAEQAAVDLGSPAGVAESGPDGRTGVATATHVPSLTDVKGRFYFRVMPSDAVLAGSVVYVEFGVDHGTRLVVPYDAVVYDAAGNTWVYTSPEPDVFVRMPVEVAFIDGDWAALASGPPAGTRVVTVGSVELLGFESGVGK